MMMSFKRIKNDLKKISDEKNLILKSPIKEFQTFE
jgi:hypothetical protein